MFNFFNKTYTYEELLVRDVMSKIKNLISQNHFKLLSIVIPFGNPEEKKVITYIISNNKLYLDNHQTIDTTDRDLALDRYCFCFNGKPKNFLELEHYEFLFSNMLTFEEYFKQNLNTKKALYQIKDV